VKVVFAGLSITSSWGNGHATNYRALARELAVRGHEVLFCERDMPWYAAHRDLPQPSFCRLLLYSSLAELQARAGGAVGAADLVLVGSYVPEGVAVATWAIEQAGGLTAFYDIDTPVTLSKLDRRDHEYLEPRLVGRFDVYLSFTGGPTLARLENHYGARRALAFHCLVDEQAYAPLRLEPRWDLGYLGTYSPDRQGSLETLLIEPARRAAPLRFVVAGPQYPERTGWPRNVRRIEHVAPAAHPRFYAAQRFTLSVSRAEMLRAGWSPSVRLFEAAACGVPVISDRWPGVQELFVPGEEILLADSTEEVLVLLTELDEGRREQIATRARERVLREHTAARRVDLLEELVRPLVSDQAAA